MPAVSLNPFVALAGGPVNEIDSSQKGLQLFAVVEPVDNPSNRFTTANESPRHVGGDFPQAQLMAAGAHNLKNRCNNFSCHRRLQ